MGLKDVIPQKDTKYRELKLWNSFIVGKMLQRDVLFFVFFFCLFVFVFLKET